MHTQTIYTKGDLITGICSCCAEYSDEIYFHDELERCVDCIEDQKFFDETMKGL